MKTTHTYIVLFSLGILALAGCRSVSDVTLPQQVTAEQESGSSPTLTVESLDNSIPLGDSFPISVKLENLPPSQKIDLQLESLGVTPSIYETSVTSDSNGRAEFRLSGKATKAQLDALNVRAFFEGGTVAGMLLVNFDPPLKGELQAQAVNVGEPITHEEYVSALPVVTSLTELKTYDADPPPALRLDGVRFPEEDGSLSKPVDLVEYNTGSQIGDDLDAIAAQASGCPSGNTYVYARTYVGSTVPLPVGTKVFISGDAPDQTRYVGANGKLCFTFNSGKRLDFRVQGWTSTGIYLHDGGDGYRLDSWLRTWFAPSGGTLTASNVLGDEMKLARSASDPWYRALRVFYKINKVYDWERFAPGNPYSSFPLSVVYPDTAVWTTRAGYGRMFVDEGDYGYDPTLFHEFGHEVYYRRMLGASQYERYHQNAINLGNTTMPVCAGSVGWDVWKITDGCAGMLEGFALWFESVTVRAGIGANNTSPSYFDPDPSSDKPRNLGAAVPGRVASYLWDITDVHGNTTLQVPDRDNDEVRNLVIDVRQRYSGTAGYFKDAAPNTSTFTYMFKNRIYPRLPVGQRNDFCAVVRRNTLAVTGMCD